MTVTVLPECLVITSRQDGDTAVIERLMAWSRIDGYTRRLAAVVMLQAERVCRIDLTPGIYLIQLNAGAPSFALLPQRIILSPRATRELLCHPHALPQVQHIPDSVARAVSSLLGVGLSWAISTRALGLGPRGEFEAHAESEGPGP